jgi:hypothetical protein
MLKTRDKTDPVPAVTEFLSNGEKDRKNATITL